MFYRKRRENREKIEKNREKTEKKKKTGVDILERLEKL